MPGFNLNSPSDQKPSRARGTATPGVTRRHELGSATLLHLRDGGSHGAARQRRIAFALTREQQKWCDGKDDASPDLRITSCTAVIEQTKRKKQKADALTNRGKAYRAKGDSDRAIRDFDEAIKIDAKDGEAFYNRGLAFRDRGETDRALQDLEQAVKFDKRRIRSRSIRSATSITTSATTSAPSPA